MQTKLAGLFRAAPQEPSADRPFRVNRQALGSGEEALVRAKTNLLLDALPERSIVGTTMKMYDQDTLSKYVVCDTTMADAFDEDMTSTVIDRRMGQDDMRKLCTTCGKGPMQCEGHPGIIPLPVILPNPAFLVHIISSLRLICKKCSTVLISPATGRTATGRNRLKKLGDIAEKVRRCPRCDEFNNIYMPFKTSTTLARINDKKPKTAAVRKSVAAGVMYKRAKGAVLSTMAFEDAWDILDRVDVTGWHALGLNSLPVNFLIKNLIVTPMTMRSRAYKGGKLVDHEYTKMYNYIILTIQRAAEANLTRVKTAEHLYMLVSMIILGNGVDGSISPPKNVGELKSIPQLIGGKDGYVRKDAMGKRNNYCARTVIGPSTTATFGMVNYPQRFADTLTLPVHVTVNNLEESRELWKSDQAKSIVIEGEKGRWYKTEVYKTDATSDYVPHLGDTIRRKVRNGDKTNFNRQPTLHKYSYMTYDVDLRETKTIGLPPPSNAPHNADFDGDEANAVLPQGIGARVEAHTIMNSENNIISALGGYPMSGLVYNELSSAWLLTDENPASRIEFSDTDMERARNFINPRGADDYDRRIADAGIDPRGGHAAFSMVFPSNFNFTSVNGQVKVRHGVLLKGQLGKSILGNSSNGIVQVMSEYYSTADTVLFIRHASRLLSWFLDNVYGFSLNFRNAYPEFLNNVHLENYVKSQPPLTFAVNNINLERLHRIYNGGDEGLTRVSNYNEIKGFVERNRSQLDSNADKLGLSRPFEKSITRVVEEKRRAIELQLNALPELVNPTLLETQIREIEISNILNTLEALGEELGTKILKQDNPLVTMMRSKAKGSARNLAQIAGLLGMQNIKGRPPTTWCSRSRKFPDGARTLPFFKADGGLGSKYDIRSKGFVMESFGEGLRPSSFFFHMAASRIGLIDTAQGTQISGSLQRTFIKYLEDFVSEEDGSVRVLGRQVMYSTNAAVEKMVDSDSPSIQGYRTGFDMLALVDQLNMRRE